jgi:TonB family protein
MMCLALIMRFRVAALAGLAALLPITAWTQEEPATTPIEPRIGLMRMTGMAGIVSSVGTSQMELTVPEHVIFTVRIGPSTQITEDGQPAGLSRIRVPSAVRVHGTFDMEAHTIEAESIELLDPKALRMLEFRSANFLKTWTSGTVTAVQPDSIVLQRVDGEVQTIQVGADTSYSHHAQPASFAWLRRGERVDVEFWPNQPPLAGSIRIQGMVGEHLTAQEATKPELAAEQLSKPSCLYCPNPDFPNEAKKDGILSARAVLEITVSEKGSVDPHDIRIIEDPGHGFTKGAVAIVKKWKFKPGTDKNGKPAKTRIPVEFTWHRSVVR